MDSTKGDVLRGLSYQWENGYGIRVDHIVGWPFLRIRIYRWRQ